MIFSSYMNSYSLIESIGEAHSTRLRCVQPHNEVSWL